MKTFDFRLAAAALVGLLFLSGCASSVKRADPMAQRLYTLSEANQVSEVSVSIRDTAREDVQKNLKFDQEVLRSHVERALNAYGVVAAGRSGEVPTVEIELTSVRVRSNFNAVMWGAMAGADHITADIVVHGAQGEQLDRFQVSVSYALGGLAGGQDGSRMGWLYEKFAEKAALELMGRKS